MCSSFSTFSSPYSPKKTDRHAQITLAGCCDSSSCSLTGTVSTSDHIFDVWLEWHTLAGCIRRRFDDITGPDKDADEDEERKLSRSNGDIMVPVIYSTGSRSQDDTCLITLSLLVVPAILSARRNSWCVAKLVPQVGKDGEDFGQSHSSGALRLSTEIVSD